MNAGEDKELILKGDTFLTESKINTHDEKIAIHTTEKKDELK